MQKREQNNATVLDASVNFSTFQLSILERKLYLRTAHVEYVGQPLPLAQFPQI